MARHAAGDSALVISYEWSAYHAAGCLCAEHWASVMKLLNSESVCIPTLSALYHVNLYILRSSPTSSMRSLFGLNFKDSIERITPWLLPTPLLPQDAGFPWCPVSVLTSWRARQQDRAAPAGKSDGHSSHFSHYSPRLSWNWCVKAPRQAAGITGRDWEIKQLKPSVFTWGRKSKKDEAQDDPAFLALLSKVRCWADSSDSLNTVHFQQAAQEKYSPSIFK